MYQQAPNPNLPPPLMKNKLFLVFLALGLACAAASIVMTIYFTTHINQCIDIGYCWLQTYNYNTCIIGRSVYCCGRGGGIYSCGAYSNCIYEGEFVDCTGRWAALWIVSIAAVSFLVGMVILAWGHKRQQRQAHYLMQ